MCTTPTKHGACALIKPLCHLAVNSSMFVRSMALYYYIYSCLSAFFPDKRGTEYNSETVSDGFHSKQQLYSLQASTLNKPYQLHFSHTKHVQDNVI